MSAFITSRGNLLAQAVNLADCHDANDLYHNSDILLRLAITGSGECGNPLASAANPVDCHATSCFMAQFKRRFVARNNR